MSEEREWGDELCEAAVFGFRMVFGAGLFCALFAVTPFLLVLWMIMKLAMKAGLYDPGAYDYKMDLMSK